MVFCRRVVVLVACVGGVVATSSNAAGVGLPDCTAEPGGDVCTPTFSQSLLQTRNSVKTKSNGTIGVAISQTCELPEPYQSCCDQCSDGPDASGCMPCIGEAAVGSCMVAGKTGGDLPLCVKEQIDEVRAAAISQTCDLSEPFRSCCDKCSDGPDAPGCMPCIGKGAVDSCMVAGKTGGDLQHCVKGQIEGLKAIAAKEAKEKAKTEEDGQ